MPHGNARAALTVAAAPRSNVSPTSATVPVWSGARSTLAAGVALTDMASPPWSISASRSANAAERAAASASTTDEWPARAASTASPMCSASCATAGSAAASAISAAYQGVRLTAPPG